MTASSASVPESRTAGRSGPRVVIPAWLRRVIGSSTVGAVFVSFLFLTSAAAAAPMGAPTTVAAGPVGSSHAAIAPHAPASAAAAPSRAPASSFSPTPSSSPAPSSGPGTFWNNSVIPTPTNDSCLYLASCLNDTGAPSIASSGTGIMATAYTAFTNNTTCVAASTLAYTEIGLTVSKDGGSTWSAPIYLGNPDCTQEFNFTSAFSPSIAILANGTFALAYIEYNASATACFLEWDYYPSMSPCFLIYDDLVISYSYNDGATWTTPQVLNATANTAGALEAPVAQQPKLAAVGNTLYLAWTNFTFSEWEGFYPPSMGLNLIVSTDGGATWGSAVQLPIQAGTWYGGQSWVGYGPSLLVNATGTLFVTYATDASQYTGNYCDTYGCSSLNLAVTESVVVAQSNDNGSTFSVATVASDVPVLWNGPGWASFGPGSWVSPEPAIAVDPTTNQLFVAYAGGEVGSECYAPSSCSTYEGFTNVWVANSTNGGANWSTPVALGDAALGVAGSATSDDYLFLPSIGVGANGVVYVDAAQFNESSCVASNCGLQTDLVFVSTDHGASFPSWYTPYPTPTVNNYPLWDGVSSSMVVYLGEPFMAWTLQVCPGSGTTVYCGAPSGAGWSQVVITSPFTGTSGVSVTFKETGLPVGLNWSAALSGNVRSGSAATSLVVTGVPTGQTESWTVPWLNVSYGTTYASSLSIGSPGSFAASTTITVTFTEEVLLTVTTIPSFQSYCWSVPGECSNYEVSPTPSSTWVTPGAAQSLSAYVVPYYTFAFPAYNMSFQSWTGTGAGNYTGLSPNVTFTPTGPVNETANFVVNGYCWIDGTYFRACLNASYYPLVFSQNALPSGTSWSVTIVTQNGTTVTDSSTGSTIEFNVPATPTQFFVWTIPGATSGQYWVPSTDLASPVEPVAGLFVSVNFTLESAASANFQTRFVETGLPANTPWSIELNGSSYGVQANNTTMVLPGGGPYSVNASVVYLESGYGYYAASVTSSQYVVNDSGATTSTVPGSISVDGPGLVTFTYKPMYLLTTVASTGGSVSPGSAWHNGGTAITLNETAAAGYHFVGWTGSGSGSTTTTQDSQTSPTITPSGPVTEFATFRLNAAPTWNLTVNALGLPTGTGYSVTLGTSSFSGTNSFLIGEIQNGSYAVSVPYVYYNSTNTSRFVPMGLQSSLTLGAGNLLSIVENGTLTISFQAQYLLTLASTPSSGGTISPAAGQYWDDSGMSLDLTATPAHGWEFVGWNSTDSSLASTSTSDSFILVSPATLTAQFKLTPIAPAEFFGLTVTETGLPTGLAWNVSAGTTGASGVGTSLTIQGLNGSYTVTVPTVAAGVGTRWIANLTTLSVSVVANQTVSLTFTQQFEVTVSSGTGGSITPAGSNWVASGGQLSLVATPNASWAFHNWSGTGTGAYSGSSASIQLTVSGPISELAIFGQVHATPPTQTTGSSTAGLPIALGLLVALLVVGLLVGLVVGSRRRGPPAAPPEEWQPTPGAEEPGVPASVYEETPDTREAGGPS